MSSARQKRLEKAQIRVFLNAPFFAPGVARLPVVFDPSVETACTDGKEIRWGTDFFDRLKDHELVTVLCHECLHPMLGHIWRSPSGADHSTWNIACDHAINLMLKDFSEVIFQQRLKAAGRSMSEEDKSRLRKACDPFPFPEPADAYCADPRFSGMSEEQIYRELMSGPKTPGGQGSKAAGAGQASGSGVGQSGGQNKTPHKSTAGPASKPKPHSMPSFGQFSPAKPSAPGSAEASQAKREASDWQNTLIQAVQLAKGQGSLPAGLARLVDGIVNPRVPWPSLLRNWLREQCADDWDFMTPDLTMMGSGFILPSLKSEKMGPVVFATDTSGSIGPETLAQFRAEKQDCLDGMRPSSLVDIYCDAKVHRQDEYTPGDTIGREAPGGGGTSFVPVFERVETMHNQPKCLIYLTDLMGTFPDEAPGYPVLWVCTEKDGKAPFGEVVYAGE